MPELQPSKSDPRYVAVTADLHRALEEKHQAQFRLACAEARITELEAQLSGAPATVADAAPVERRRRTRAKSAPEPQAHGDDPEQS